MATFIVTNTADDGIGSLRDALAKANASADADVIEFAAGVKNQTITLSSALAVTQGAVEIRGDIEGDGEVDISISGASAIRHLTVASGAEATLVGLRLTDGAGEGASSIANSGVLTIRDSTFEDNEATGSNGSSGGDAGTVVNEASGVLRITDTLFENNQATGGDAMGGYGETGGDAASGVVNRGDLTITRSGFQGEAIGGTGTEPGPGDPGFGGDGGYATVGVLNDGGSITSAALGYNPIGSIAMGGFGGVGNGFNSGIDGFAGDLSMLGASGGSRDDTLTSRNGVALGFDGEDRLTAEAAGALLAGHDENDTLIGGAGADTLLGGANDDLIQGGAGGDEIDGGFGDDRIELSLTSGSSSVEGGAGDDELVLAGVFSAFAITRSGDAVTISSGGATAIVSGVEDFVFTDGERDLDELPGSSAPPSDGDDDIRGSAEGERIDSGAGDDTVRGLGGDDTLIGRDDDDLLIGGRGDDKLRGNGGEDELRGGGGADTLIGGAGDDVLKGGGGADVLRGGGGADDLIGAGRGDRLIGGAGGDDLNGGRGADVLIGGRGADDLIGGAGADRFVFVGATGVDDILDFQQGVDRMVMRQMNDFADLSLTQDGADVRIGHSGGVVVVEDALVGQFSAADFIF